MDVPITKKYQLVLSSWKTGTMTIRQVELFVKTEWLTREQADNIYTYPRAQTALVIADPYNVEVLLKIQSELKL